MLLRSREQHVGESVALRGCGQVDSSLAALLRTKATWLGHIESVLAPLDVSFLEYEVLCGLRDADGPLTQQELAAMASVQSSGAAEEPIRSLLTKHMIEAESVRSGAVPRLRLTAMGVSRHAMAARALDRVSARFAAVMPDADRATLDRILSRVRRASDDCRESRP